MRGEVITTWLGIIALLIVLLVCGCARRVTYIILPTCQQQNYESEKYYSEMNNKLYNQKIKESKNEIN